MTVTRSGDVLPVGRRWRSAGCWTTWRGHSWWWTRLWTGGELLLGGAGSTPQHWGCRDRVSHCPPGCWGGSGPVSGCQGGAGHSGLPTLQQLFLKPSSQGNAQGGKLRHRAAMPRGVQPGWGGSCARGALLGWCQHRAAPQGDPGERPPASDPAAEPAGECGHPVPRPSSPSSASPTSSASLPHQTPEPAPYGFVLFDYLAGSSERRDTGDAGGRK